MKIKQYWSKTLFIEGIIQTKWIAVIGTIVCALFIGMNNYAVLNLELVGNLFNYNSLVFVNLAFIVAIMYRLFGFIYQRKAGDLYYSLPSKRLSLYITNCSVALCWLFIMAIVLTVVIAATYGGLAMYSSNIAGNFLDSSQYGLSLLIYGICIMGAYTLSMATTGTGVSNVLTMLIIIYVPGWLVDYYISSYYELIRFIEYSDKLHASGVLSKLSINGVGVLIVGLILLVVGGILFVRRKTEIAGVASINKYWQLFLRTAATMLVAIKADSLWSGWLIHKSISHDTSLSLLLFSLIALLLWFGFDLLTEKSFKKLLIPLKQLPVLVIINLAIVASFTVSGYVYSKVPELENIESVRIKDYSSDTYDENRLSSMEYIFEEEVFTDNEDIELILKQLSSDMEKYRSSESYKAGVVEANEYYISNGLFDSQSNDGVIGSAILVEFMVDGKPMVRKVNLTNAFKQSINSMFAKRAETLYDYEFPLREFKSSDMDRPLIQDCLSFGWDFSEKELLEIYNQLYSELKENEVPLIRFMGRDYNKEGVFDFINYYNYNGEGVTGSIDIPISVDTPKTLELLANMGNKRRLPTFDFDWFVDYIKNIGNKNAGGTLEVILYAGDGDNIRYESFSWWSNYTADMSDEELDVIHNIVKAHEGDGEISADENLLMLVYKNIDGMETTGYWFNLTDEEAATIDSLIWSEGKFERYKYFNYYN